VRKSKRSDGSSKYNKRKSDRRISRKPKKEDLPKEKQRKEGNWPLQTKEQERTRQTTENTRAATKLF
jgi:hypothetical protein